MANDRLEKVALALTTGAIGFCAGEMFSPLNGWSGRLQWETLVTAIFAIAAAAWSVHAIREADQEQGRRHREVINLSFRADRLLATRTAMPHAKYLWTLGQHCRVWVKAYDDNRTANGVLAFPVKEISDLLAEKFFPSALEDGAKLFGPAMSTRFYEIKTLIDQVRGYCEMFWAGTTTEGFALFPDQQNRLYLALVGLAEELPVFSDDLFALAAEYNRPSHDLVNDRGLPLTPWRDR